MDESTPIVCNARLITGAALCYTPLPNPNPAPCQHSILATSTHTCATTQHLALGGLPLRRHSSRHTRPGAGTAPAALRSPVGEPDEAEADVDTDELTDS
jgi:hypothetical protein